MADAQQPAQALAEIAALKATVQLLRRRVEKLEQPAATPARFTFVDDDGCSRTVRTDAPEAPCSER